MARRISSSLTIVYKFFVVSCWLIIFFTFTMALIFAQVENWWSLLGWWIFAALFGVPVLLLCVPLKRVLIDGDQLVVSNYIKAIRIDLSNIADVTENLWIGHYIWVHLKNPTAFGKKIIFIPTMCLSMIGSLHPVVSELKQLAGLGESADDHTGNESETTRPDNHLESD